MRSQLFRMSIVSLLTIVMALGCATPTPNRPLTPAETRMREQSKEFNRTILEGALFGGFAAAAGCGIAALAGALDPEWIILCAAVGAGAGAIAGTYVAKKKDKYATEEQALDSVVADIEVDNQKVESMLADARTIVAADTQRIDQIDADVQANRMTLAQAKVQMNEVKANEEFLAATVEDLKKRRDEWRAVADNVREDEGQSTQADEMDATIAGLEKKIASMEQELDALTNRRKTSVVG